MEKRLDVGWKPPALRQWLSLATTVSIWLTALLIFIKLGAQVTDYHSITKALCHLPPALLAGSLSLAALSFLPVIARDVAASRLRQLRPSVHALLLASLCGAALDNAVGLGSLTGKVVRRRLYRSVGLEQEKIERTLSLIGQPFLVPLYTLFGSACLFDRASLAHTVQLGGGWFVAIGLSLLAAGGIAVALDFKRGDQAAGVYAVRNVPEILRLCLAAGALWSLLPGLKIDFLTFATIFAAAGSIGAASRLPGGIAVFEAVVLLVLWPQLAPSDLIAALIAFRGIYFLTPLLMASTALGVYALGARLDGPINPMHSPLAESAARLTPRFLGIEAFIAGCLLVVSGATPTFGGRLATLSLHVPLWIVEGSHFLGSLIGVLFLFISHGLFCRHRSAWWVALALSAASLVFSLGKGLAYGEVIFVVPLVATLFAARSQFRSDSSFQAQRASASLLFAIAVVIAASFAILTFAFHDMDFAGRDFWWQFEFDAQAPRALRAMIGVSVVALVLATWELSRAPRGFAPRPAPETLAKVAEIIRRHDRSDASLALMGDKSIIFSATGNAFLMYGKRGRSWIALYDPIGPRAEWPSLIDAFQRLAARHGGRVAFYQVRPTNLPIYLEAGLSIIKLGEEARVDLVNFTLEGGSRSNLRYALKRGAKEEFTFSITGVDQEACLVAELDAVSRDWLTSRRTTEKSFSVAAFHRPFVKRQSIALVRQHGRTIAFVTFMPTSNKQEATVGLMRHIGGAPGYTMEYLFTQLILALKDRGYHTLDLGMAPFSGFRALPLTSPWHRMGSLIWQHANPLYNFQGLRLFKGKFGPSWEPRYLAASGLVGPFVALADAAALIGKHFKEIGEA
ncbi:bifunctional lysylphosphatidylglycerol flippase/synthetase MprF [Labrys okinawensis]|uniref:bifunctional lysylphosphatidylglycerol flippase/synthetase MprF n=1 Tax=Labrys okinawensis TaxID=346911 RepID=UPI0039BD0B38